MKTTALRFFCLLSVTLSIGLSAAPRARASTPQDLEQELTNNEDLVNDLFPFTLQAGADIVEKVTGNRPEAGSYSARDYAQSVYAALVLPANSAALDSFVECFRALEISTAQPSASRIEDFNRMERLTRAAFAPFMATEVQPAARNPGAKVIFKRRMSFM